MKKLAKTPEIQELIVPAVVNVFVDQKTNARTLALPFILPDDTNAVLMLCRLKDATWEPHKLIKKIIIQYA